MLHYVLIHEVALHTANLEEKGRSRVEGRNLLNVLLNYCHKMSLF